MKAQMCNQDNSLHVHTPAHAFPDAITHELLHGCVHKKCKHNNSLEYHISTISFLPWIVVAKKCLILVNLQVLWQLFEICVNLQIKNLRKYCIFLLTCRKLGFWHQMVKRCNTFTRFMLKLLKWATIGCGHIILTFLELLPPCHTVANILKFCPKINDEASFYVLIKEIMI